MKATTKSYRYVIDIIAVIVIVLIGLTNRAANADALYIGDDSDNTVKSFEASTGKYLGIFVSHDGCPNNSSSNPPVGCLYGPRGLVVYGQGHLLVADQNIGLNTPGAIYEYNSKGAFVSALIPYTAPNAPPAPRGIILYPRAGGITLFVASLSGVQPNAACIKGTPAGTGCLQAFDVTTRAAGARFIGFLPPPSTLTSSFHPRGVVVGPDGLLYVSNDPVLGGLGGHILRYDPEKLTLKDVFVDNVISDFNRPEGLVFGPDGNLYVTSFKDPTTSKSTDKVLIFAGPASKKPLPGTLLAQIDLDQAGQDRAYAQALLFGPGPVPGHVYLFVPISTPTGSNAGQVRRYDVTHLSDISLDIFVPPSPTQSSPLGSSWYLTFGYTNPVTLDYSPPTP
jgi:DNA-binding beta-propeller fold protein YncE